MGVVTLAEWQADIETATGRRATVADDAALISRAINYAYQELASAIEFKELNEVLELVTTGGQSYIDLPDTVRVVISVIDKAIQAPLEVIGSDADYFFFDRLTQGRPTRWRHFSSRLYLYPNPNMSYTLEIPVQNDPAPLVTTTAISKIWDQAIFYLSTASVLIWIGEEQRGTLWLNRAIAYLQTRVTPEELEKIMAGRGLSQAEPIKLTPGLVGGSSG